MRVAIFDAHRFEQEFLREANARFGHDLTFFEPRLTPETASLANGFDAISSFVNDRLNSETLKILSTGGVRLVALRSAGFNHVDLKEADRLKIAVTRVPAYSPHAVSEHAVCLLLAVNRKICRANSRVREFNFSLDGLVGFDLFGKTVGIVGTGKIGAAFARAMLGFGSQVLAFDLQQDLELAVLPGLRYTSMEELFEKSDVISLHVPLTPKTRHLIDAKSLELMKPGVILINTGRGALIDTPALIQSLKSGQVGGAGLDVYEEEENIFFQDLSGHVLQDDVLARLLTFPNVLITSHQAFLTREALSEIAHTTLESIHDFQQGRPLKNQVTPA
jgi:D-lactate dehydrogenase